MAVYPIYKSRHAGANPEAAQKTPVPQSEKIFVGLVPAAGRAARRGTGAIELTTAERPLMLTESENGEAVCVEHPPFRAGDERRVLHDGKKVTEVYFNNEKTADADRRDDGERDRVVLVFDAAGGGRPDQLCHRPPGGRRIGYGVAVEGKDDNGNELTFKLYIPFSSEIKPELTPEDFTGEAEPQENQAFIRLTPEQNPAAITQDAFFEGGKGLVFQRFHAKRERRGLCAGKSVTAAFFYQGKQQRQVALPTSVFGFGEMRKGGEPMIYEDAAAYQALDSVGVMLKGTDANGNALSFTTLVHFFAGDESVMQNLGEKIRQARRDKGLTQEQLAQALFVSRQTVSNWENGKTEPDYQTLVRLSQELGMEIVRTEETPAEVPPEVPPEEPARQRDEGKARRLRLWLAAAAAVVFALALGLALLPSPGRRSGYTVEWFQQEAADVPIRRLSAFTPRRRFPSRSSSRRRNPRPSGNTTSLSGRKTASA